MKWSGSALGMEFWREAGAKIWKHEDLYCGVTWFLSKSTPTPDSGFKKATPPSIPTPTSNLPPTPTPTPVKCT